MLYVPAWNDEPQFTSVDVKHTCYFNLIQASLVLTKHMHIIICLGLTWLVVVDISKQEEDDAEGGESSPPGEQEHQHHRDHRSEQSCPFTVVVK